MRRRPGLVRSAYDALRPFVRNRSARSRRSTARRAARTYRRRPAVRGRRSAATGFRRRRRTGSRSGGIRNGAPCTSLKFTINHKKAVTYEKNESMDIYRSSGAFQVVSKQGEQEAYGRAFWTGDFSNPATGRVDSNTTSMEDILVNYGVGTNVFRKVQSTLCRMKMLSASTGMMKTTIYFLRANKDTPSASAATTWPRNAWVEGSNEIPTIEPVTSIGARPYFPAFGTIWKICKKRTIVMNPGQALYVTMKSNEHYRLNTGKIGGNIEAGAPHCLVGGRSYGILVIVEGYPVTNQVAYTGVGIGLGTTIGSAKLTCTWDWEVRSSTFIHANTQRNIKSNTFDGNAVFTVAAQEVDDDAGVVTTHATA